MSVEVVQNPDCGALPSAADGSTGSSPYSGVLPEVSLDRDGADNNALSVTVIGDSNAELATTTATTIGQPQVSRRGVFVLGHNMHVHMCRHARLLFAPRCTTQTSTPAPTPARALAGLHVTHQHAHTDRPIRSRSRIPGNMSLRSALWPLLLRHPPGRHDAAATAPATVHARAVLGHTGHQWRLRRVAHGQDRWFSAGIDRPWAHRCTQAQVSVIAVHCHYLWSCFVGQCLCNCSSISA